MNRFYSLLPIHITIAFLLGFLSLRAQNDTLFYEDFSDSTLSNWTVIDSTNRAYNWIWTKVYPTGHWRPTITSMISTTSANGFICFPADFYNTPWNPPVSGIDTMNGWIISKAIPITPRNRVEIQFRQFLSYCCNTFGVNSGIQFQVSADSLNWSIFDVTSVNARSGSTANSELQIHDVSSVLVGEDTAYVRFRFSKNGWYYWMVDDFFILGSIATSIEEVLSKNVLDIFPNPTNGLLNIQGNLAFDQLEVRDINGRLVHRQDWNSNDQSIDLSFLENGLYFLRMRGEEERIEKIMLQKP